MDPERAAGQSRVSRRQFLVGGAVVATAGAAGPAFLPATASAAGPGPDLDLGTATATKAGPKGRGPGREADAAVPAPYGLMAGLLGDPLGVGSASPRLWWQVPVSACACGCRGVQGGYELELVRDARGFGHGTPVESTGRVVSPASTAVAWPFPPLAARACAWWRVRAYHGPEGRRPGAWSAPQRIVTGPAGDWPGAAAIWAAPAPAGPADATFRATITIRELRAGIFLRVGEDLRNGYMWQLTAATATAGSLLRPHVLVNGGYTLLGEVRLPMALSAGSPFELVVECRGNVITTGVNGQVVDSRSDTRFAAGHFGVRTGNSESFLIDDVVVTDGGGATVYANSFSAPGDAPFYGSLDGDRLLVGRSTAGLLDVAGPDHWALLRKEFDLPAGTVAQAVLYCAADDPAPARQFVYRAWCNGQHAGVGPTRSADAPRHETHDVTELVRAGSRNALAFQCWARSGKRLQALLDVYYADGSRVTVASDGGWQARRGGAWLPWAGDFSTPSYTYSAPDEAYDARREPVGWHEPGYAGDDFAEPVTGPAIAGLVAAATVGAVRRPAEPAGVRQLSPTRWLVDAGKELVGGLRLSVDVPASLAGSTVRVLLGEELNADGSVRYQLRAQTTYDERWTLRAGQQVIEHWGFRAFRWAELVLSAPAAPAQPAAGGAGQTGAATGAATGEATREATREAAQSSASAVTGDGSDGDAGPGIDLGAGVTLLVHVAPEPAPVGSFSCSNEDLNRVWQLCSDTIHANRQDLFMDTPTREREAYEADLLSHARGQMALSRSYDLGRHTARYLVRRPQWPTEYKFMSIAAAWEEYLETGDPDALDADFALHAALQADAKGWLNADGLVEKNPGASSQDNGDIVDWPASQRDGYVFTTVNTVVNTWQYQGFRCMQRAAEATGRTAEAQRYGALADTLRAALNQRCFDPATGAYRDGPSTEHTAQHAAAFAASLGVTEEPRLPDVARWLASDAANPVRVSSSAVLWLLEALYRGGDQKTALDVMTSRRDASWLAMMEQWGATMTMEAWSPTVKSNTTFSHPWSAGPAAVIARCLLGVRVTAPGASSIEIAPAPADLDRASGTVATVRGPVSVDIEQRPGYRVTVGLPGNMTGLLRWPTGGAPLESFTVSGSYRRPEARVEGSFLVVELGPGETEVALSA